MDAFRKTICVVSCAVVRRHVRLARIANVFVVGQAFVPWEGIDGFGSWYENGSDWRPDDGLHNGGRLLGGA
jgi:hypothetical protein